VLGGAINCSERDFLIRNHRRTIMNATDVNSYHLPTRKSILN
jgi:hypothetical protein